MAEIGAGTVEILKKQAEEIHGKQKDLEAKIDDLKYQIRKKEDAIAVSYTHLVWHNLLTSGAELKYLLRKELCKRNI